MFIELLTVESLIRNVEKYLPLVITVISSGEPFLLNGPDWEFSCNGSWRISTNHMTVGCFDEDSSQVNSYLKNIKIIEIKTQDSFLKIDPTFILSDGSRIDIFSTNSLQPWIFRITK